MILEVHVPDAPWHDIGDEIWQEPLANAIRAEAKTIAGYAGPGADMLTSALAESTRAPTRGGLPRVGDEITDVCLPLNPSVRRKVREWPKRASTSSPPTLPSVAENASRGRALAE